MIVISRRGVPALTGRIDDSTRICADAGRCPGAGRGSPASVRRGQMVSWL